MRPYDVIIVGAGASGLMCALTAAQRGRQVLVLDHANKIGKKILLSGGGRCNFTNLDIEAQNYISSNPHFCKSALKRYTQWDFIALLNKHQIAYHERDHGQLFCHESAKQIRDLLVQECEQAGASIQINTSIESIEYQEAEQRYQLKSSQGEFSCTSLVIASGGLSFQKMGASGFGYTVAKQFSIPVQTTSAGLVPFTFSEPLLSVFSRLSGQALPVCIRLGKQQFCENLLFTHRGLSGPAILQISNYWQPGDDLSIDLSPHEDLSQWLLQQKQTQGKKRLRNLLLQFFSKAITQEFEHLFWPQLSEHACIDISDKQLLQIAHTLHHWQLKPAATEGYRTAEVTRGGVDTHALSSKTMECKQQPGLYFIGEVVDVTGHLGGYNFQWAWSSGFAAGLAV